MEMLMARAEAERGALERELRAMRCTASEAASHLHLAEEGLRVRLRCTSVQQNRRCCCEAQPCYSNLDARLFKRAQPYLRLRLRMGLVCQCHV